MDLSHRITGKK